MFDYIPLNLLQPQGKKMVENLKYNNYNEYLKSS